MLRHACLLIGFLRRLTTWTAVEQKILRAIDDFPNIHQTFMHGSAYSGAHRDQRFDPRCDRGHATGATEADRRRPATADRGQGRVAQPWWLDQGPDCGCA